MKYKDMWSRKVRSTLQRASRHRHISFHIPHSTLHIPHSTFHIPHSSFHIPHYTFHIPHSSLLAILIILSACSNDKNTAQSRWWHSFNAKYNTYFNGSQAYIDGSLEKENGHHDNFTEMIPLYPVSNKNSKEIGKGNFNKAIEKSQKAIKRHSITRRPEWNKNRKKTERDIEWLNRSEYNPFLWKAWMLMGRSQFHQGAFDEAASTFAYMSRLYQTQPAIYGKARAWLAKCYIEQDWIYDAEDVISKMKRDSLDWRAVKEWDYTFADYYIHTGRYEEAIPYLKKVIKHEMRKKQKAREWYLLGQIEAVLGHHDKAYQAFRHVIRQSPPYELEFNARIAMSEVMAGTKDKQMISRLKRMARSDKNKEYLDQVYYAIGNIYLSKRDTLNAIAAYEKGNEKATRAGIEKGVLLLHLGDLYWARENFSDARRCYGEAIGLLDKDRDDYEQLSNRSRVLDELVPHTDAIHLQDSLQALAKMSEDDRNAAIDRVIEALKKKEKEERNRLAEEEAMKREAGGENFDDIIPNDGPTSARQPQQQQQQGSSIWYFYNPTAVNQGKSNFQRTWGKRENVDDWQRVNKTVVAGPADLTNLTDEQRDSLETAELIADSLAQATDSVQNDPHKREYYLAQIPFTEEQVEESNMIIKDALYHSGVIFKDKLDNLRLSEKQLRRLTDQYPDFEHMDDVFYHLWLLYQRKLQPQIADNYLDQLKEHYPESQWTVLLNDPYFEENARFGTHIEDSLYAATYAAFKASRLTEVKTNTILSAQRFPIGEHRDKFIFIGGLAKLNDGDGKGCVEDMQTVVNDYPQSDVSALAGMIINGVNAGRRLHGGKFDMGDVWTRRSEVLQDSDSIAARVFTAERNDRFVFMMAYEPDSVNENQLLYEMARFNFTSFMVRNFDIEVEDIDGLHRMRISGFLNYDEAWQYARQLYKNEAVTRLLRKARMILISEPNLELLGTQYSYNDYDEFYEKHFVPLKISTVQLLTEPADLPVEEEPVSPASEEQEEILNGGVLDNNTLIDLGIEPTPSTELEIPSESNEIPADEPTPPAPAPQQPAVVVEEPAEVVTTVEEPATTVEQPTTTIEEPAQPEVGIEIPSDIIEVPSNGIEVPSDIIEIPSDIIEAPSNNTEVPSDILEIPSEPITPTAPTTPTTPIDEPVFEITDDPTETPVPNGTVIDIEDEYYELDGF